MSFFWVGHFDFFFQEKKIFCFISMKTSSLFIWGIIYLCNMDGFFRILEKTTSELICTRLYLSTYLPIFFNFKNLKSIPRYCSAQCRHLISHANLILTFSDILILQASTIRTSIDTCQIIAIIIDIWMKLMG